MDFKEWLLNEFPITDFQLKGQWGPNDKPRGYSPQDIGILTNPKAVAKIHRKWSNTKENFALYFLRAPNAKKAWFTGKVTPEWVKENLGLDIPYNDDLITLIYTQNSGGDVESLTAWVLAHRLGHALSRNQDYFNYEFDRRVKKDFSNILWEMFPKRNGLVGRNEIELVHIARAVGTMRSARQNNLANFQEFIFELVAQYIITGRITFKPLTKSVLFKTRMNWGKPQDIHHYSSISDEKLASVNDELDNMATRYTGVLESLFDGLRGDIFVI